MSRKKMPVMLTLLLILSPALEAEEDQKIIEGSTVIGNAEFPQVEYALPWQPPPVGKEVEKPVAYHEQSLRFVDRAVLQRKIRLYKIIRAESKKK